KIPIGVATIMAMAVMAIEPKIAFRRPPAEPGGGVFWVNISGEIAPRPFTTRVMRITARKNRPITVARTESPRATTLVVLRRESTAMLRPYLTLVRISSHLARARTAKVITKR